MRKSAWMTQLAKTTTWRLRLISCARRSSLPKTQSKQWKIRLTVLKLQLPMPTKHQSAWPKPQLSITIGSCHWKLSQKMAKNSLSLKLKSCRSVFKIGMSLSRWRKMISMERKGKLIVRIRSLIIPLRFLRLGWKISAIRIKRKVVFWPSILVTHKL